jgi:hypothetical protein
MSERETNSVACFASDALTFSAINQPADDHRQADL